MGRPKKVNRLGAVYKKLELSEKDLQLFVILANRRDIRSTVVSRLSALLNKGEHFDTPLMVNLRDGKMRLLDGNHRIEAIAKHLARNKDNKVEVGLFCYRDLDDDTEKKIYTKWNLGTKQTVNDFVKQYWDDIPIAKMFNGDFPYKVAPKWSSNAMEFRMLMQAYRNTSSDKFYGTRGGNAMKFIEFCQELGNADYKLLKVFLNEYIGVFGLPSKRNMHYKPVIFSSILHIWRWNSAKVNPNKMMKALTKLRGHERVVYYGQFQTSSDTAVACHRDLLAVLNGSRKKPLFV